MALYIHIGCNLTGKAESNRLVDRWLHFTPLLHRLDIMETVLEL